MTELQVTFGNGTCVPYTKIRYSAVMDYSLSTLLQIHKRHFYEITPKLYLPCRIRLTVQQQLVQTDRQAE